jgi:hypothetical protein
MRIKTRNRTLSGGAKDPEGRLVLHWLHTKKLVMHLFASMMEEELPIRRVLMDILHFRSPELKAIPIMVYLRTLRSPHTGRRYRRAVRASRGLHRLSFEDLVQLGRRGARSEILLGYAAADADGLSFDGPEQHLHLNPSGLARTRPRTWAEGDAVIVLDRCTMRHAE